MFYNAADSWYPSVIKYLGILISVATTCHIPTGGGVHYLELLLYFFAGEYIKNWRPRWFVLKSDGQFIGFRNKPTPGAPPAPGGEPLNNFKLDSKCVCSVVYVCSMHLCVCVYCVLCVCVLCTVCVCV